MSTRFTLESNRQYWEDPDTISIVDKNLHELEIQFITKFLRPQDVIADIGCGDGHATLRYAEKARYCYGIERSRLLLQRALENLAASKLANVEFLHGDILELSSQENKFDVVVTQRVLINLPSWELQMKAIENIRRCLKRSGTYVLIENTNDGNDIINDYRSRVDLQPIPMHWHNKYLDFSKFLEFTGGKFRLVERRGFNLYYLLTRVYMQMFASFTGSGNDAKPDPIFEKADRAARVLFEKIGDKIEFKENPVFGPIQGIALEKIGP